MSTGSVSCGAPKCQAWPSCWSMANNDCINQVFSITGLSIFGSYPLWPVLFGTAPPPPGLNICSPTFKTPHPL